MVLLALAVSLSLQLVLFGTASAREIELIRQIGTGGEDFWCTLQTTQRARWRAARTTRVATDAYVRKYDSTGNVLWIISVSVQPCGSACRTPMHPDPAEAAA